jgi:plasmid stabilization system protein ParE
MVRWSYTSKADLLQIYNYIAKDSIYYAKKVVNDIVDKSEYIDLFPNIGRNLEEIDEVNVREIIVYSYRMIYRIVDDGINILTIVKKYILQSLRLILVC